MGKKKRRVNRAEIEGQELAREIARDANAVFGHLPEQFTEAQAIEAVEMWRVRVANYRLKLMGVLWFDGAQPQDPDEQTTFQLNPDPSGIEPADYAWAYDLTEAELLERCEKLPRPDWVKFA